MTEVWPRQCYIKGYFYPLPSKATTAELNFALATPLASLTPFLSLSVFSFASLHTDVLSAYGFRRTASINYTTPFLTSCNFPRLQNFTNQTDQDALTST